MISNIKLVPELWPGPAPILHVCPWKQSFSFIVGAKNSLKYAGESFKLDFAVHIYLARSFLVSVSWNYYRIPAESNSKSYTF